MLQQLLQNRTLNTQLLKLFVMYLYSWLKVIKLIDLRCYVLHPLFFIFLQKNQVLCNQKLPDVFSLQFTAAAFIVHIYRAGGHCPSSLTWDSAVFGPISVWVSFVTDLTIGYLLTCLSSVGLFGIWILASWILIRHIAFLNPSRSLNHSNFSHLLLFCLHYRVFSFQRMW